MACLDLLEEVESVARCGARARRLGAPGPVRGRHRARRPVAARRRRFRRPGAGGDRREGDRVRLRQRPGCGVGALQRGAVGYLRKDQLTPETLATAVKAAADGTGVVGAGPARAPAGQAARGAAARARSPAKLTDREQQVLSLIAAGHPTREVAPGAVLLRTHREERPSRRRDQAQCAVALASRRVRSARGPDLIVFCSHADVSRAAARRTAHRHLRRLGRRGQDDDRRRRRARARRAGPKVAVVTIDPARRLANSLGLEELGNEPRRVELEVDGELWAMMLDAKRTFDELIEHLAPDEKTRDEVFANRIYQQLSSAVAGSQEFTAIAKLYELDATATTTCSCSTRRRRATRSTSSTRPAGSPRFFQGRAIRCSCARPGSAGGFGRGTGRRLRRAAAGHRRRPAARPVGVLPLARRDDRRLHRARPARRRAARGPGDDVPDRHRAAPRPGRGGDLLPPQAARGGDAVRRARRQPRPPAARRRAAGRASRTSSARAGRARHASRRASWRRWPPATPRTSSGCATRSATRRRSSSPSSTTTSTTSRVSPCVRSTCSSSASARAGRRRPGAGRGRGGRRARRAGPRAGSRRARRRARRPRATARTKPAIAARSSEIASRRGPRGAARSCGLGADRGEPLGDALVAVRSASANSARAASSQSVSASTALGRSQPSSKRRSAQASSPARGVRRGDEAAERAQRVLLLGGEQAVAGRAAQAGGERDRHPGAAVGAGPGGRAERRLGVVPQAQRGLQAAQPAAGGLERAAVAARVSSASTATVGVRVVGAGRRARRRASSRGRARARRRAAPRRTRSRAPRRGVSTTESSQPA